MFIIKGCALMRYILNGFSKLKYKLNIWSLSSIVVILILTIPSLSVFSGLFYPGNSNWIHFKAYLLSDYISNTVILISSVGIAAAISGTLLAWLVCMYDFPGRRFFKWALILPLSIPPYMGAYTYAGIFDYTGPVQTLIRQQTSWSIDPRHFDIMSIQGASFIFTIFLFPYVYMLVRSFLVNQSSSMLESSRLLGSSGISSFFAVIVPLSRVSIAGGVSLVMLEVLNDYGVVKYLGIPALSTAIFKAWFSLGDIQTAIKLSSYLMLAVCIVLILEKLLRGRRSFSYSSTKIRPLNATKLHGLHAFGATTVCALFFSAGFLVPLLQLASWSFKTYASVFDVDLLKAGFQSALTAGIAALLITLLSIIIANSSRISKGLASIAYSRIISFGYSIPGAVIAIGVLSLFVYLDRIIHPLYSSINSSAPSLLLSGSILMLIFAYVVRFMSIGYNSIDAGFEKNGRSYYEASRTLGMNITQTFFKVDMKMLKPAIASAFILVFVDILKELPLTLILRPFNFNTLSTKAFQYANDEMVQEASIASLIIVLISAVLILLLNKKNSKGEHNAF